jgi:aspartate-semialdehyde dehydrogenase
VAPPGEVLPLALALRPIAAAAGVSRMVGTVLEAASATGRDGIDSLYRETLAIFNQDDPPEPGSAGRPVAFDCLPATGPVGAGGVTEREARTARVLARLLERDVAVALTLVQVPAFIGLAASLALELDEPLEPKLAEERLAEAPGVDLWPGEPGDLTLRVASGRDAVIVGRVRRDPSRERGLLLWLAADTLRLAAVNAVALVPERLRLHH